MYITKFKVRITLVATFHVHVPCWDDDKWFCFPHAGFGPLLPYFKTSNICHKEIKSDAQNKSNAHVGKLNLSLRIKHGSKRPRKKTKELFEQVKEIHTGV